MGNNEYRDLDEYLDFHFKNRSKDERKYKNMFHYNEYLHFKLNVSKSCLDKMRDIGVIIETDGNWSLVPTTGYVFFKNLELFLFELRSSLDALAYLIKFSFDIEGKSETDIRDIKNRKNRIDNFPTVKRQIEELLENELFKQFNIYRNITTHRAFLKGLHTVEIDDSVNPPIPKKKRIVFPHNPNDEPYKWEWRSPDNEYIEIVPFCEKVYELVYTTITDIKDDILSSSHPN